MGQVLQAIQTRLLTHYAKTKKLPGKLLITFKQYDQLCKELDPYVVQQMLSKPKGKLVVGGVIIEPSKFVEVLK